MAAIVVAPTAALTAKTVASAPGAFRLGFGLVNGERAAPKICAIECRDSELPQEAQHAKSRFPGNASIINTRFLLGASAVGAESCTPAADCSCRRRLWLRKECGVR